MFTDRIDAGTQLAERLEHLRGEDLVVVGLPRGGVPVAHQVAQALDAPLDVILVRKLGVPFQPELAMGAIGEDGVRVVNELVVELAGAGEDDLAAAERREQAELDRRVRTYRGTRPRVPLTGRTVVVVDDGVATGATAKAACQVARKLGAAKVVLAVPVAPDDWTERMVGVADELVAVATPELFFGIGQFYRDFSQTSDEEVIRLLTGPTAREVAPAPPTGNPSEANLVVNDDLEVPAGPVTLRGHLTVPQRARGVVIFAHGAGSSRHSPRNRFVASTLNSAGLATLLFDLLTEVEEADRANVFDIELLTERLIEVTGWVQARPELQGLAIGYFGASTGAAAALSAAAALGHEVAAVVSRGGRPDLSTAPLGQVVSPTLLIVGGNDQVVLDLNRSAASELRCPHRLDVVPGATHLFEEPGALAAAATAATDWFSTHAESTRPMPSPGQLVWVDLGTTDVGRAQEFYGATLGWTYDELTTAEGSYVTALVDGRPTGGLMALSDEQRRMGQPSTWNVFFASADIDRDVERVVECGGRVVGGPFEIPGGHRIALVSDPVGAVFALATFTAVGAGRLRWDEPGALCWVECQTRDVERAVAFYERFFGWTGTRSGNYVVLERDGQPMAGLMSMPPAVPEEAPSHWFTYWRVENLDAASTRAIEARGTQAIDPMTIDEGRFTVIEDPTGAVFGLFEPA